MSNRIKGFDYERCAIIELTRAEWQQRVAKAIKAGGFQRATSKNTYVYTCGGRIEAEICADISVPFRTQVG
jgi:hypothetical protein